MSTPLIVRRRALLELARNQLQPDAFSRAEADAALTAGPFSVADKATTPPSGDRRDYMSQGPYWWPNPETPNGLPYIRRDGEVNPESEDTDRPRLVAMTNAVDALSLGWFFTGEACYAEQAAELLRVFFLDEQRGMRPNLNFGQGIPGHCDGRGIGIIETWIFAEPLLDAILLLQDAPQWPAPVATGLREWFSDFLDWLLTSPHGHDEAREHNNHGTAYDLQVCALAMFTGRDELARETLTGVGERRIAAHIEPDGSQPHELARTRALSYTSFNLRMLTALAEIGERAGVDLWRFESGGRSLRAALDWLVPYWTGAEPFTYPQIAPFDSQVAELVLRRAAHAYQELAYQRAADSLALGHDSASAQRCRLLYPPLGL